MQRGVAAGACAGFVIPVVAVAATGGPPGLAVILGTVVSVLITVFLAGFLTLLSATPARR